MSGFGTISRGVKAPIIKKGDDLIDIVATSVISACENEKVTLQEKDVVAVTEAIVARAQGNYATCEEIATDVKNKTGGKVVGLIFPIFSRNRFSMILKGIAMGVEKLIVQLSYPGDEVGNKLIEMDALEEKEINPFSDTFTESEFKALFPSTKHTFTGVDYIEFYKNISPNIEIILSNKVDAILAHTDTVIGADIHTRQRTKSKLLEKGAKKVLSLDEILNTPVNGSGYHETYGLLGSNLATDTSVKLFPRDTKEFAVGLQREILKRTNVKVECMVYGDGAFKDPVGGIWELADPVVSPGFTDGLVGTPNELKLKYIADNEIANLSGKEAEDAMKKLIKEKNTNLMGQMASQGTTPRQLTDLLGSLSDLTSGSGDKGTPIILIQNYFKNYAEEN